MSEEIVKVETSKDIIKDETSQKRVLLCQYQGLSQHVQLLIATIV